MSTSVINITTYFHDLSINLSDVQFHGWNATFHEDILKSPPSSPTTILILSGLFFLIGTFGIFGNLLVICAILGDKRMRSSVTNLLIMNLAVSDLIIMVACIPDIIQFIENTGWKLGVPLCKALRFTEVFALYASVMTLVSVCVERYIAIIHPIKAHILCCRTRIILTICTVWPCAMLCASPNLFYHELLQVGPHFSPCVMRLPDPAHFILLKYGEFLLFYLIPLVVQVILYIHIGKRLFSDEALNLEPAVCKEKFALTIRARKGVVKMLVAGVTVYFISFSPHQILLFYNTFSKTLFQETWSFLIFVNIMAYASSACNPLLYSIFSQKFRHKFSSVVVCRSSSSGIGGVTYTTAPSVLHHNCKNRNFTTKSVKTTVTEV